MYGSIISIVLSSKWKMISTLRARSGSSRFIGAASMKYANTRHTGALLFATKCGASSNDEYGNARVRVTRSRICDRKLYRPLVSLYAPDSTGKAWMLLLNSFMSWNFAGSSKYDAKEKWSSATDPPATDPSSKYPPAPRLGDPASEPASDVPARVAAVRRPVMTFLRYPGRFGSSFKLTDCANDATDLAVVGGVCWRKG
jgi:hypothetical protein